MKPMSLPAVCGSRGAPMGRRDVPPPPGASPVVRLARLRWVDGDYDQGGAYWGGGMGDHVYWAHADADDALPDGVDLFVRARSRGEAKDKLLAGHPGLKWGNT